MPHDLLESELFGHERGAFTGAHTDKRGLFELADAGTLFLDEIDDMPLAVQAKLLRVLESRQVMRVGGTTTVPIDVRLITGVEGRPEGAGRRRLFRSDLFYRIRRLPDRDSRRCATGATTCRCSSSISCSASCRAGRSPSRRRRRTS